MSVGSSGACNKCNFENWKAWKVPGREFIKKKKLGLIDSFEWAVCKAQLINKGWETMPLHIETQFVTLARPNHLLLKLILPQMKKEVKKKMLCSPSISNSPVHMNINTTTYSQIQPFFSKKERKIIDRNFYFSSGASVWDFNPAISNQSDLSVVISSFRLSLLFPLKIL